MSLYVGSTWPDERRPESVTPSEIVSTPEVDKSQEGELHTCACAISVCYPHLRAAHAGATAHGEPRVHIRTDHAEPDIAFGVGCHGECEITAIGRIAECSRWLGDVLDLADCQCWTCQKGSIAVSIKHCQATNLRKEWRRWPGTAMRNAWCLSDSRRSMKDEMDTRNTVKSQTSGGNLLSDKTDATTCSLSSGRSRNPDLQGTGGGSRFQKLATHPPARPLLLVPKQT